MRIGCLGWGSLIWSPGELPLKLRPNERWNTDGPLLPVEFARKSKDGRLTLVIYPGADPICTYWAELNTPTLEEAIHALKAREGTPEKNIGYWARTEGCYSPVIELCDKVGEWAEGNGLDAVVWTALASNFKVQEKSFSVEHVVCYISRLKEDQQKWEQAEEYVRRAPLQTNTRGRRALRRVFQWEDLAEY